MNTNARTLGLMLALIAAVSLCGCGERREVDAGPATTETRDVGDFDSIALRGSAQLRVRVGIPRSLKVEGSEAAVAALETAVHGDTLRIRTSRREWMMPGGTARLVIHVTLPTLKELRLEGGNDVRLVGLNGGVTTIDIEGAANLEAQGRVDELSVHMAGAGHADLRNLIARDASVSVDGVGAVYVNSTHSLDATMNGVGAILYSGTPREINTSMHGVGTISRDSERKPDERSSPRDGERTPVDPDTLQPEYEKEEVKLETTEVV
jgi:hypothetical protein